MGYRLKEVHEEKRLTQEELAAKSGVFRQTIVAIETDPTYNTTFNTLVKLSDALETPIDSLFLR